MVSRASTPKKKTKRRRRGPVTSAKKNHGKRMYRANGLRPYTLATKELRRKYAKSGKMMLLPKKGTARYREWKQLAYKFGAKRPHSNISKRSRKRKTSTKSKSKSRPKRGRRKNKGKAKSKK